MKTLLIACAAVLSLTSAASASEWRTPAEPDRADRLDQARLLIFDRDWPRAVVELRRVLANPKEPLRDEASFWLAHSLFHMGDAPEALRVIDEIERHHVRSRWMLPAQSLRVEIATRLKRPDLLWRIAVKPSAQPAPPAPPLVPTLRTPHAGPAPMPTPPHAPRPARTPRAADPATPAPPAAPEPPDLPSPPVLTFTDVRIQALSGLMRQEPGRAVPVLREIVTEELESPQARRALFVLGLSTHEEARETLIHFARTGPEGLRVVAVEQLGRWPTLNARNVLTTVYASSTQRVKLEVLRSLREAGADRELIRLARDEKDAMLRGFAIAQLRELDTEPARAFLRSLR